MRFRPRLILFVGFFGAGAFLAGCGSPTGNVNGKVTYKGAALNSGMVMFTGPSGKVFHSPIDSNGGYAIKQVEVGSAKIAVSVPYVAPSGSGPFGGAGGPPKKTTFGPPKGAEIPPEAQSKIFAPPGPTKSGPKVPEKYADAENSGLRFDVKAGDQTHDIVLN
jgi:hypothetical protein